MIVIHANSPAGHALRLAAGDHATYKISLDHDGEPSSVKIKVNEGMWSPPLRNEES